MAAMPFLLLTLLVDVPGRAGAKHPVDIAAEIVTELYLKPLQVDDAYLSFEAEPYGVDCAPDSIEVKILAKSGNEYKTRLEVGLQIVEGRVVFLAASGELLDRKLPSDYVDRVLGYLEEVNGWSLADLPRPRGTKGLSEGRMIDPNAVSELDKVRRVLFRDGSNALVLVGVPNRPTGFCAPLSTNGPAAVEEVARRACGERPSGLTLAPL